LSSTHPPVSAFQPHTQSPLRYALVGRALAVRLRKDIAPIMLMNPTIGTHPYTGYGIDPARQELNRLFYGNDYFRPEMMDRSWAPWGTYGGSPIGYDPRVSFGYRPIDYTRPYDYARPFDYARPIDYTRPYDYARPIDYARRYEPTMRRVEFNNVLSPETGAVGTPCLNVAETPDAFLAVCELPGCDLKDVNLQVQGDCLLLTAYRRPIWSNGTVTVNYHMAEGHFGTYRRLLPIPAGIAPGQIQANFVNGLLTIVFPKAIATNGNAPVASIVINSALPTSV